MSNFFNYIQPTIVQLSHEEDLPESLRGRYMVNVNIFGIEYFLENYIMVEDDDTDPNNDKHILLQSPGFFEIEGFDAEVIDIPRMYIVLTQEFIDDDRKFQELLIKALQSNKIFAEGTNEFVPGVDYYINNTLYDYLVRVETIEPDDNIVLPNYLTYDNNTQIASITKYFIELDDNLKDYRNLDYFLKRNALLDNEFTEDELKNFYANFCKIILDNTQISADSMLNTNNQIYDLVLKYFANYQSDAASVAINLLLNSLYSTPNGNTASCGCQQTGYCGTNYNGQDGINYQTSTCYELYKNAMSVYIKSMLGDTQFYKDWFTIAMPDGSIISNDTMIELLKTFINEFMGLGYNINFNAPTLENCGCPSISSTTNSACNYNILTNYIQVLDWVQSNSIDANKNKIKIYGQAFGEILPKLIF